LPKATDTEDGSLRPQNKTQLKERQRRRSNARWVVIIIAWTFVITVVFTYASERSLSSLGLSSSILVILFFIFIGILFDIIGIAVASADETPFHSMNARKLRGARQAIMLIRNAGKVSNFCNDVVGDICNIITGSASTSLVAYFVITGESGLWQSLIITSVVASLTIGGKAVGKAIAIRNSERIIYFVGRVLAALGIWKNASLTRKYR